MACSIDKTERYVRMSIGGGFVVAGFLARHDAFAAVALVSVGSAMTAAAALGY